MMISVGHKNFIGKNSIVAIMKSDSTHARKIKREAAEDRMLINAANGKKIRSLIVLKLNQRPYIQECRQKRLI